MSVSCDMFSPFRTTCHVVLVIIESIPVAIKKCDAGHASANKLLILRSLIIEIAI